MFRGSQYQSLVSLCCQTSPAATGIGVGVLGPPSTHWWRAAELEVKSGRHWALYLGSISLTFHISKMRISVSKFLPHWGKDLDMGRATTSIQFNKSTWPPNLCLCAGAGQLGCSPEPVLGSFYGPTSFMGKRNRREHFLFVSC